MTEVYVQSPEEMFDLIETGSGNRKVSATGMNLGSSRSHSVVIVAMTQKDTKTGSQKTSSLFLVDLAGSEMVRKTSAKGQQLEEAKMINKSLTSLGLVIMALTEGKDHIPYRNSKLTRMLQESLGGNARTILIICCSPSSYNCAETISTCGFGTRAKKIKNKARVNQQLSAMELQQMLKRSQKRCRLQLAHIRLLEELLKTAGVAFTIFAGQESAAGGTAAAGSSDASAPPPPAAGGAGAVDMTAELKRMAQLESDLKNANAELASQHEEMSSLTRVLQERETEQVAWKEQRVKISESAAEEAHKRTAALLKLHAFTARLCSSLKSGLADDAREIGIKDAPAALAAAAIAALGNGDGSEGGDVDGEGKQATDSTVAAAAMVAAVDQSALKDLHEKILFEISEAAVGTNRLRKENAQLMSDLDQQAQLQAQSTAALGPELEAAKLLAKEATVEKDRSIETMRQLTQQMAELSAKLELSEKEKADQKEYITNLESTKSSAETRESDVVKRFEKRAHQLENELAAERKQALENQSKLQRGNSQLVGDVNSLKSKVTGLEEALGEERKRSRAVEASFSPLTKRERQKYRSVNQRLNQLVGVHRKLLRKYATLELEIAEARHKLSLRDERIKQLELNARMHNSNMHTQAGIHANELSRMRAAHKKELKALRTRHQQQQSKMRIVTSHTGQIVKPIIGGKRRTGLDNTDIGDDGGDSKGPGFFARMWRTGASAEKADPPTN